MAFPHALPAKLLLLLFVAGAAAMTPSVNGTCPADSSLLCQEQCCNDKERCGFRQRPTQTSTRKCEPKSYLIAGLVCGFTIPTIVLVVHWLQSKGKWPFRRAETSAAQEAEMTPVVGEAAATAESEADKAPKHHQRHYHAAPEATAV
jgi:hypothetical protein